jgi:hypothetical protein
MIQLPVRIELRDRLSDRSCGFTIFDDFLDYPSKGDHIIIAEGYLSVTGRFHFCKPGEDPALMVVTSTYLVEKYDDMLRLLDWFKEQYEISDFKSDSEPASYYSFYRSIIRLLGWKTLDAANSTKLKVLSAGVAAVLVAEIAEGTDYAEAYKQSSPHIEELLRIVLNKKRDGEVDLLDVIKIWESDLRITASWKASEEQVLAAARFVFPRYKSIPVEMLPDGLK